MKRLAVAFAAAALACSPIDQSGGSAGSGGAADGGTAIDGGVAPDGGIAGIDAGEPGAAAVGPWSSIARE